MSTIRKQSIVSSIIVYIGFALGLLNTYLFTKQGGLKPEQFGLINTFIAIASVIFSVAGLGMPAFLAKFFPYYKAHLNDKKNDQLAIALTIVGAGFLIVLLIGIPFKHILIDKVFANSPELPRYFYWVLVFGFGYSLYMVMDAYALQHREAPISNFLKEVFLRFIITVLIILTTVKLIKSFDLFIGIYAFSYLLIAIALILFLFFRNKLHLSFTLSNVTRKFYKKIVVLSSFVWGGSLVFNLASVFDGIVIAAVLPNGMAAAGIFYAAQNISSLMQAPQRAIVSASIGPLSAAWKEKNLAKINRIYYHSSINQLLFSSAMFCLIWMNFDDGIQTFHLQNNYAAAKWIFFYIGLSKIIDMGTGLNAQIIGTSTAWRFDFTSGMVLLGLSLPLNYFLTKELGIIGPGITNLVSFTVYNAVRFLFLYNRYKMQPFSMQSLYCLLISGLLFLGCYFLFNDRHGFLWIVIRSSLFAGSLIAIAIWLKLSPDIIPVWNTFKKRLRLA